MNHAKFIAELGGATEVSRLLTALGDKPVHREAVYKWARRNGVPWRWRLQLASVAESRGIRIPADFFPKTDAAHVQRPYDMGHEDAL